jgi:hypothetical protein
MMLSNLRMQATMTTLAGFPAAFKRSEKALITAFHRMAVTVDMYKTLRTSARPPQMRRFPRCCPLSLASGAIPANAAMALRSRVPSSGSWASRVAEVVAGPHPWNAAQKVVLRAPGRAGA